MKKSIFCADYVSQWTFVLDDVSGYLRIFAILELVNSWNCANGMLGGSQSSVYDVEKHKYSWLSLESNPNFSSPNA
jgi:hypothetical protein